MQEDDHERGVLAFVASTKVNRYAEQLGQPRKRRKFVQKLAHFRDWDERWLQPIPGMEQTPDGIRGRLLKLGAPADCYVISTNQKIDGRKRALTEALDEVVGCGEGAVISCIPGRLLYYEGEEQGDRWILFKRDAKA